MISTTWLDENKNVVLWQFPEMYSRETFLSAEQATMRMMSTTHAAQVDIIMLANRSDLDGTSHVLDSLVAMIQRLPVKTDLVVLVVPPMVARIMRTTWNTINGGLNTHHLQFVSSLEEAQVLLNQMRAVA